MPLKITKPTDQWAQALRDALADREVRPAGDGWKTTAEVQDSLKLSRVQVYAFISKLKKSGKIEVYTGKTIVEGRLCRQIWYRFK